MESHGQLGTSLGRMQGSPRRRQRDAKRRRREEMRWRDKCGEVNIIKLASEERQQRDLPPC